jgi:hypothetical protein
MTIQAVLKQEQNSLNVIHIRLPFTDMKPLWIRSEEGLSYLVQILAEPLLHSNLDPKKVFSTIANQGGYTIGWSLDNKVVHCGVADAEYKNFSREKGRQVSHDVLFGFEKDSIVERYSFSFELPEDWKVTEREGSQFVLEADHPFMDLLRKNFLIWLENFVPHPGAPDIFWLNGTPCLYYKELPIEEGDNW